MGWRFRYRKIFLVVRHDTRNHWPRATGGDDDGVEDAAGPPAGFAVDHQAGPDPGQPSEATHPREVVAIYARRIEQLVMDGCSTGCQDAAGLVARMAALRSRGEHTALSNGAQDPSRPQAQFHAAAVISTMAPATWPSSWAAEILQQHGGHGLLGDRHALFQHGRRQRRVP